MKKLLLILLTIPFSLFVSSSVFAQTTKTCLLDTFIYPSQQSYEVISKPGQTEVGQTSMTVYSLSRTEGGEKVGIAVIKRINLGLASLTPGPESMYETAGTFFLPEGTFNTFGVSDYDHEVITKKLERPMTGGTGKYAGVRGVLTLEPLNKIDLKGVIKAVVPC